jgi:hypothetical protein
MRSLSFLSLLSQRGPNSSRYSSLSAAHLCDSELSFFDFGWFCKSGIPQESCFMRLLPIANFHEVDKFSTRGTRKVNKIR